MTSIAPPYVQENVENLQEGGQNHCTTNNLCTRRKTAFVRVLALKPASAEKYIPHLIAYKEWVRSRGCSVDEFSGILHGQTDDWLNLVIQSRMSKHRTEDDIKTMERPWEKGPRITESRAADYIDELVETIPENGPTIFQRVSALVFWAKIETIITGAPTVPRIRTLPLVAANLESLARNCVNLQEKHNRDRQGGALSDGYTDAEFTMMLHFPYEKAGGVVKPTHSS